MLPAWLCQSYPASDQTARYLTTAPRQSGGAWLVFPDFRFNEVEILPFLAGIHTGLIVRINDMEDVVEYGLHMLGVLEPEYAKLFAF